MTSDAAPALQAHVTFGKDSSLDGDIKVEELGLAEAIRQLRKEITIAARNARGDPLQFTLGSIELELEVELIAGVGAKAEFKWVVVSAGAEAKADRKRTHRVNLKLTPLFDEGPVSVR